MKVKMLKPRVKAGARSFLIGGFFESAIQTFRCVTHSKLVALQKFCCGGESIDNPKFDVKIQCIELGSICRTKNNATFDVVQSAEVAPCEDERSSFASSRRHALPHDASRCGIRMQCPSRICGCCAWPHPGCCDAWQASISEYQVGRHQRVALRRAPGSRTKTVVKGRTFTQSEGAVHLRNNKGKMQCC